MVLAHTMRRAIYISHVVSWSAMTVRRLLVHTHVNQGWSHSWFSFPYGIRPEHAHGVVERHDDARFVKLS